MKSIALKVLIVVTSHSQLGETGRKTGYYLPEVTHPYFVLKEAGLDVDFASPQGGKAPMDETSRDLSDSDNRRFLADPGIVSRLDNTLPVASVKAEDYGAILYVGGHGTMWDFPNDADLARLTSSIHERGGVVAAVCHGPAALVNLKRADGRYLVEGRTLTAFSNEEEDAAKLSAVMPFSLESRLIKRGARYRKASPWTANVVTSERLVTGQNPASARGVAQAVVTLLKASSLRETPRLPP